MNIEDLPAYHKHITDTYDVRSGNHDNSQWHRETALKLINDMPPGSGDFILDIGTGTGTIAFHAASLVGAPVLEEESNLLMISPYPVDHAKVRYNEFSTVT